jgi:hypothetical protein
MRAVKKVAKVLGIALVVMVGVLVLTGVIFVNVSRQFGASPSEEQRIQYAKSLYYHNGIMAFQLHLISDLRRLQKSSTIFSLINRQVSNLRVLKC